MSNLPYQIKTIAAESEFKFKEKGSMFIGLSSPITELYF